MMPEEMMAIPSAKAAADAYEGWSTGYNGNFPVVDGHHWTNIGSDYDGAKCKDCGLVASNNEIACGGSIRRQLPECTVG